MCQCATSAPLFKSLLPRVRKRTTVHLYSSYKFLIFNDYLTHQTHYNKKPLAFSTLAVRHQPPRQDT